MPKVCPDLGLTALCESGNMVESFLRIKCQKTEETRNQNKKTKPERRALASFSWLPGTIGTNCYVNAPENWPMFDFSRKSVAHSFFDFKHYFWWPHPQRGVEHANFVIRVADRAPLLVDFDIGLTSRVMFDVVGYFARKLFANIKPCF